MQVTQFPEALSLIVQMLQTPTWEKWDFWLFLVIGLAGLAFSLGAFIEARQAKAAATEAGRIVKIQTITIELTEISQKLDGIRMDIHFNEARDLLAEMSRRLRRIISPFQGDQELKETVLALRQALTAAKESLNGVRPTEAGKEIEIPFSIYYAIEGEFATVNNIVADLLGMLERRTFNFGGETNGN